MHFKGTLILLTLMIVGGSLFAVITDFDCTNSDNFSTELTFTTPAYELKEVDGMQKITLPQPYPEEWAGVAGMPELPVFSTLVSIPAGVRVTLNYDVIDEDVVDDVTLVPYRNLDDIKNDILGYSIDPQAYYSTERGGTSSAELGEAGIMRDKVLQRVIVHPFRYDSNEQRLFAAREIRLSLSYQFDSRGLTPKRQHAPSLLFDSLTNEMTANPTTQSTREAVLPGCYLFIYDGTAEVLSTLQPLLMWKHAKGHEIQLLDTSTIGNNSSQIRAYIQEAWETWENPPEFVCIVGDGNMNFTIPTFWDEFSGHSVHGDHPYTQLDGNDLFPEVLIGRLTFNNVTELQTIVGKILRYEYNPPTDDNWFERPLLVADHYSSGISTVSTMIHVADLMQEYNPSYELTFVDQAPFTIYISNALNAGKGAYFYRGFGNFSDWLTEDTFNLFNYNKNPFMSAITCYTGTFAQGSMSSIEAFLRAGTPSTGIGASSVIGSSSPTHTCFNNLITGTIAYGIYHEGITNFSAALALGKLALYECYPTNPNEYVDWYTIGKNLLGDPGMTLWTRQPESFTLDHAASIGIGEASYQVIVSDSDGNPVEGAVVTLIQNDGEIDAVACSNESGIATLYFEPADEGDCMLTVTNHNFFAERTTIPVGDTTVIDYTDVDFTAPAVTGGTASFNVTLHNYSADALNDVSATLAVQDEELGLVTDEIQYGNIASGSEASGAGAFQIEISPLCEDGSVFDLTMSISSGTNTWETHIPLTISGPKLAIGEVTTDPAVVIPGNTIDMTLALRNEGHETFEAAHCEINSVSQLVTITSYAADFGDIAADSQAENTANPYQITISEEAITGSVIPFTVIVSNEGGITQELDFDLHVGEATMTDPTGPDNYGYYCYDDGDTAYDDCPTYNWIEIDPNYGGAGTSLNMTDNDTNGSGDMVTIDLPFAFRFYEINYSQISVSSNGYIVMGPYYTFEWMNWPLPGTFVPSPIIAPFWDDLLITEGNVYVWYDEAQHAMVVQWSRLLNRFNNSPETFQAILYDPEYNSTLLGDSKIKFQYLEINNVDQGNYYDAEIDHGEYATVGIADHTTYTALEYTYSNLYPASAKPLEDEMALLFTGPNVPVPYPHPYVSDLQITDVNGNSNGLIDYGETVEICLVLSNLGLQIATDVTAEILSNDPYVTIQQAIISFPDIPNGESSPGNQPFIIDIADNCPNNHTVNLTLMIHYSGINKELQIPFQVYSPELTIVDFSATDDNDDQLESGETGTFTFTLERSPEHVIHDATITLVSDAEGLVITPGSVFIEEMTEDRIDIEFQVTVQDTCLDGENADFNLNMQFNDDFNVDNPVSYVFGHPELVFSTSFDEGINYDEWLNLQGSYSDTDYAGGESGELLMTSLYYDAVVCAPRMFSSQDLQKLIVKFRYRNMDYNAQYGVLVQQNSSPYTSIFLWQDINIMDEPGTMRIDYVPDVQFTGDIILVFFIYPTPYGSDQVLALDDIEIYAIRHNPGVIEGTVTLNGGPGNVEDVTLRIGSDEYQVDSNGNFSVSIPEGYYTVRGEHDGYITYYEQNIQVVHNQVTHLDIELDYLSAPFNLAYEVDDEQIHLTWDYTDNPTRATNATKEGGTRDRDLDYFDVVLVYQNTFVIHANTTEMEYSRDLIAPGHYEFYVQARHVGGYMSDESNHVEFNYVGIDDQVADVPVSFELYQNHPNPFNPTTSIQFDLPKATSKCLLAIYNVRGEKVKTLVDEPRAAGRYTETWDGRNRYGESVSSGVYFIRIETDTNKSIRKAVMLK